MLSVTENWPGPCVWDPKNCWHHLQSQLRVLRTTDNIKECCITTETYRKQHTSEVYCMAIHKSFISGRALQAWSLITTAQTLMLSFNSLLTSAWDGPSTPSWTRQVWTRETHPHTGEEIHQPKPSFTHVNQSILAIINITPLVLYH